MTLLIGMDEAGYGPNLGPLVISATVWHTVADMAPENLYDILDAVVCRAPVRAGATADRRLVIADSKAVYKSRGRLGGLERTLFPALGVLGHQPTTWVSLWDVLAETSGAQHQPMPWYSETAQPVPTAVDAAECHARQLFLHDGLKSASTRLVALQSVAVFPREFNTLTRQTNSKGHLLTSKTLALLQSVLPADRDEPVIVVCDKHGGRNRYGPALQHQFPDDLVEVHGESRAVSVYRWGPAEARIEVRFQVGGERMLPTALASMASKYLRELAMHALNAYWAKQVPGLRPTAGYPVDAKRFKSEIAMRQTELGIDDLDLWRDR